MAIVVTLCLLLTAGCCWAACLFLSVRKDGNHKKAFVYKGMAGLCFVIIGLILALYRQGTAAWLIAFGLFFGLIGDELLALRNVYPRRHDLYFCSGAVSFTVGHVLYMAAFFRFLEKPLFAALPAFGVLLIISCLYTVSQKVNTGKMKVSSLFYMAIVSFMCAMALCAATQHHGIGTLMLFIGSFSFYISDNLLVTYTFSPRKTRKLNITLHIFYYLAQLLIGWSILFL